MAALHTFQIGLPTGYVLLYDYPNVNIWHITIVESLFSYGIIDQVYNGSLIAQVGNPIMYKKENRIQVNHSSATLSNGIFYIIKESDIVFYVQNYPAP